MASISKKHDEYFDFNAQDSDLKGKSVRGGIFTFSGQIASYIMQLFSTAILARLLTPTDYGVVAMAVVVIGFAEMFNNLGLSTVTIQQPEITHQQVSVLFWINIGLSLIIGVILIGCSPLVASFYNEPRVISIIVVLTGTFILGGSVIQHQALLRRQMRFGVLSIIQFSSMLSGVVIAVVAAFQGVGYWALIFMQVAVALCNFILTWIFCSWRPAFSIHGEGVKSMLAFGGNLTGVTIVNYFSLKFDTFLIGKLFGATVLGLYTKAFEVLMLPVRQLSTPAQSVAISILSKLINEPQRYRNAYFKILNQVILFSVPGIAFMIATADLIFDLLLGQQWGEAARIFQILGCAGFPMVILISFDWLFITQGRSKEMLHWGLLSGFFTVLAVIVGINWSVIGVAAALVVRGFLILPLTIWFVCRSGPIRMKDFIPTMYMACILALVVLLAVEKARGYITIDIAVFNLGINFIVATFSVLIIACLVPIIRKSLLETVESLCVFFKKK